MTQEDAYYFAGGERIELHADPEHVGVDLAHAASLPRRRLTPLLEISPGALSRRGRPQGNVSTSGMQKFRTSDSMSGKRIRSEPN